jgi:hypothetical protein
MAGNELSHPGEPGVPGHNGDRDGAGDARAGQAERPAGTAGPVRTDGHRAEPRSRDEYAAMVRAECSGAPETVTIDGKEIVVTHDRADGLWASGLPGDPPYRVGDVLTGAEEPEPARGEKLFRKAIENGDDLLDSMENNVNLGHDALRPPVHADVPVPVPGSGHDVPHHELDAGNAATAALTLGLLTWAAGNWAGRKLKGTEDAGHR